MPTVLRKIKIFTDRYPLLGPSIWILVVEYFITQVIVAQAWHPGYSWRFNTISDLGNTMCGMFNTRLVCSPHFIWMNASFIALGLLMASGSLLIYQEFRESRGTLVGFSLMAIAGLGTMLVGFSPENRWPVLHIAGAAMPFLLGNASLIVLAFSLYKVGWQMRAYAFVSGLVPLIALGFFVTHHYGSLGIGGVERLVGYPQTVWLIIFGLYMSSNHFRYIKQLKRLVTPKQ